MQHLFNDARRRKDQQTPTSSQQTIVPVNNLLGDYDPLSALTKISTAKTFKDLPTELRLQVWEEALPGPRVLEVYVDYDCIGFFNAAGERMPYKVPKVDTELLVAGLQWPPGSVAFDYAPDLETARIRTTQAPPSHLSVCRECREVVLRKYTLSLDTTSNACHIPFDPIQDTLWIPAGGASDKNQNHQFLAEVLDQEVVNNVRLLAVDYARNSSGYATVRAGYVFLAWSSLQGLKFIRHDADCRIRHPLHGQEITLQEIECREDAELLRQGMYMWEDRDVAYKDTLKPTIARLFLNKERCCVAEENDEIDDSYLDLNEDTY